MRHTRLPIFLAATMLSFGSALALADQAQPANADQSYYLNNTTLAGASARAAKAQASYDQALADAKQTVTDSRQAFVASNDYQSAQQELVAAQKEYDKAAKGVQATLAGDPTYKQLTDARASVETDLRSTTLSSQTRLDLATRKMRLGTALAGMETKAWTDSPDALQAKNHLTAARLAMKQLIDKFEASLPSDPKVAAAKTVLENAAVEKAEASAYLNGAIADKIAAAREADQGFGSVTQYSYPYGIGNPYMYGYDNGFFPYYLGYGGFPYIIVNQQHNHDHDHDHNNNGTPPFPYH